jgi:hypothetical protein
MTVERPTLAEIRNVVNNNVYCACPELLIKALTESLSDEWLSMHDTQTDDDDEEPPEILEYWLVSPWFGEGMQMYAQEPAMELEPGIWIWGRTESGLQLEHSAAIGNMMVLREERLKEILNR